MKRIVRMVFFVGMAAGLLVPSRLPAAEAVPALAPALTLPRTGQISAYDQTGKLIDFKGSGQDGEYQRGEVWPDPRFIINGDGTVSDTLTGLMWLKEGNCFGQLPWPAALQMVAELNQGSASCLELKLKYHDWFLPDVEQLASLLDAQAGVANEYFRLAGFTGVENGIYWSATAYRGKLKAWGVDFSNGQIAPLNKLEGHYQLLARVESAGKGTVPKVGAQPQPAAAQGEGQTAGTPAGQRFVDHGDGTVTDTLTGLMWLRQGSCLSGLDWQGALAAARRLNAGEQGAGCPGLARQYSDWSLPNGIELRSLVDYEADYPSLSQGHPFQEVINGYWTATTVAAAPEQALVVDLDTGATLVTPKGNKHRALLVRQVTPPPERPRKEAQKGGNLGVQSQYVLALDPTMASEIHWPPLPRFVDNGDGTSMDTHTGVSWLTDANCIGKKSWGEAGQALQQFNAQKVTARPTGFKCEGYEGGIDDWELPTLAELSELINKEEKDGALWLNQQGVKNVQGGGLYWTVTETPLNLYFADAVNLKTGKAGNYPKSLQFFVWPKRHAEVEGAHNEPLLNLTANAIDGTVTLSPQDPISLVVSLHTFGLRAPADFWFWYETPDEKRLWLTAIRTWTDKATPVYQGPLFNLKNYEIYRSTDNGLAPGVYEFHFVVDTTPNGTMDEPHYQGRMQVVIPAGPEER